MACVAVTLLSCQKEAPVVPEEETPEVQPIPAPEENVLVYHAGIGIPETKTTLYGTKNIYWKTGDKILAKVDESYEAFTLNEGAGSENATFTYSGSGGSTLDGGAPAFYGYKIGESGGFSVTDATHVILPDTYAWSDQGLQAPMMDADGTNGAGKFSLMGTVLKVDVENIPAAANKLVFTATGKNISGAYEVTSGELVLSEGPNSTITITFTAGEATSRTFFIPLPTGTYDVVCPVTIQNGETVLYTKNIKANGLVLSKGDLLYVPGISASNYSLRSVIWTGMLGNEKWEDKYILNDDFGWEQIAVGDVIRFTLGHAGDLELYYADAGWTYVEIVNTNLSEAGFYDLAVTQEVRDHLMIKKSMRVVSNYSQLSRMEWLSPASPETVLWSGTHNLMSKGDFKDLQLPGFWTAMNNLEGKVVTIYYEDCIDGTDKGLYKWISMDVKNPEGWSSYCNGGHNSGGVGAAGSCTMEITSAIETILKTSGMYIAGGNVNLTKITLK